MKNPLRMQCQACGRLVTGVFILLEKVDGKYFCPACAATAKARVKNPNLARCHDCGQWVSNRASICPNCGASQTQTSAAA